MEQIKTFTGDVVQATSPIISEQEAIDNASFGKYSYDPSTRLSTVSLPGWQGYSTSYNPNGFYGQPMGYIGQAMNGYGFNPYYMNQGIGANPYGYQYGSQPVYQGYNPAYIMQMQRQQQQMQQPQYIQIQPLNYRGEFLPPKDYESKLAELSNEFWMKEQEQTIENKDRYNQYNNFGYNYYGSMMYGNFYNNPVRQEANNIIQSMQQEARENRIAFNVNLGKLAFNLTYGQGNYDEEKLEEIYRGRTIENPMSQGEYNQLFIQNRFANCVPYDNSIYYQNFHAQVSAQHNAIIDPNSGMVDAFKHAGELWAMYEMEEEQHRRRNLMGTYDSNGYKYFIQKSIAERKDRLSNRFSNDNNINMQYNMPYNVGGNIPAPGTNVMNIYPGNPRKLSHVNATESIDKDGNINVTLSLPVNFGSKAGSNYIVNSQEAAYDKKREEFNRFVDSIPGSIYNGQSKTTYCLAPGGGG